MTQDEFREAMNAAKREDRLLWLTNGVISGLAVGYDSGTDEVVFHKNTRAPLSGMRAARSQNTPDSRGDG